MFPFFAIFLRSISDRQKFSPPPVFHFLASLFPLLILLQFWIFKFRTVVVPTDFRCLLTLPRSPHNFPFLTNFPNSSLIMVHTRRSPLSQPSTVVTRSAKVSILFALVSKNEDGRYSYEVCRACALSHFPMVCRKIFSFVITMLVSSPFA